MEILKTFPGSPCLPCMKEGFEVAREKRPTDQIALDVLVSDFPDEPEFFRIFDAFHDDVRLESLSDFQNAFQYGPVSRIVGESPEKRLVDLQRVRTKGPDHGQGSVTGSEVVKGNVDAKIPAGSDRILDFRQIADQGVFCNFQLQPVKIAGSGNIEKGFEVLLQSAGVEVSGRDIDPDAEELSLLFPLEVLIEGFSQSPSTQND